MRTIFSIISITAHTLSWTQNLSPEIIKMIEQFPEASGKIVIAFLTILIPLGIAVLQDFFTKKPNKSAPPLAKLDLHVILDQILRIKHLMLYAATPYLFQALWPTLPLHLKILADAIIVVALIQLSRIILDLHRWSKGNQLDYRLAYLSTLVNEKDMVEVWQSVWEGLQPNFFIERRFFEKFSDTVTDLLNKSHSDIPDIEALLLETLKNQLHQRSPHFIEWNEFTLKILEWHSLTSPILRKKAYPDNDVLDNYRYDSPHRILEDITESTIKKIAISSSIHLRIVLERFSEHTSKYGKHHEYVSGIISTVLLTIFASVEKLKKEGEFGATRAIRAIPKDWRITTHQIKSKNKFSLATWNIFVEWVQDRIYDSDLQFDATAELITSNLFPLTDPISFSKLLYFAFLKHSGKDLPEIIRFKQSFGLIGRVISDFEDEYEIKGDHTQQLDQQINESIKLIQQFFPWLFTKEKLKKYIDDLNHISTKDEEELYKINFWKSLFQRMAR